MHRKVWQVVLAVWLGAVFSAAATAWAAPPRPVILVEPPPLRDEVMPAPRAGYEWAAGHWAWRGNGYAWSPGRWMVAREGYAYQSPRWSQAGGRWAMKEGQYERLNPPSDAAPATPRRAPLPAARRP